MPTYDPITELDFHEWKFYRCVVVRKKDGERIEGVTLWDGLSSLYTITTEDGTRKFVTCLDHFEVFEEFIAP